MKTSRMEDPPRPAATDRTKPNGGSFFWVIVVLAAVTIGSQMGRVSAVALTAGDVFRADGIGPGCNMQTVEENNEDDSDSDSDDEEEEPEFYSPSYAEMVLRAKVVLFGRVTRRYDDSQRYGPTGYTAEMDVYCTFKGVRSQRLVNISYAGYNPGMCFSTSLEVGREYVVVAEYYGHGGYLPADTEIVASSENVRRATSVCRLNVQYPHGIDHKTAVTKCPIAAPPGECLDENHFTTTTTVRTTTTTENYDEPPIYDEYGVNTDGDLESTIYQPPASSSMKNSVGIAGESLGQESSVASRAERIGIFAMTVVAFAARLLVSRMNSC